MKDDELYAWAHQRARQLRAFYVHLGVYLVVMVFLLIVNAVTRDDAGSYLYGDHMYHRDGGDWWVIWPALGWGVAVAIHGVVVGLGASGAIDSWEDRKVEQLVRCEKDRSGT
jgi:hypothetical protein